MQLFQTKTDTNSQRKLGFDWMSNNPGRWRGKQVINRKNGRTYTIRDVMRRGQVELENKGVLYSSNVLAVRQDFEPVSP